MGCAQSIPSPENSPKKPGLERLKLANGYIKAEIAPKPPRNITDAQDRPINNRVKDLPDKSSRVRDETKNTSFSRGRHIEKIEQCVQGSREIQWQNRGIEKSKVRHIRAPEHKVHGQRDRNAEKARSS